MEVLLLGTLLTTAIGAFGFFLKHRFKKIDDNLLKKENEI